MTSPRETLPKCPLCGRPAYNELDSPRVSCSSDECRWEREYFTVDEWRRLAAPAMPAEVVAVLMAIAALHDIQDDDERTVVDLAEAEERRDEAETAWLAAGRPGLPAKDEKEKT